MCVVSDLARSLDTFSEDTRTGGCGLSKVWFCSLYLDLDMVLFAELEEQLLRGGKKPLPLMSFSASV